MMRILTVGIFGLVLSLTPAVGHATITFELGNHPSGDVNILLNGGTTGTTVTGTTNQTPSITVAFSSLTDTLTEPSQGQARVESTDGSVNNISVAIPGGTYTDLIINPFLGDNEPGTATVSVQAVGEPLATFTYDLGNGQNFLTIVATGGETISSTTIDAPNGFGDLRQPRISGAAISELPPPSEPGLALLLGLSTSALALYRRWKSS